MLPLSVLLETVLVNQGLYTSRYTSQHRRELKINIIYVNIINGQFQIVVQAIFVMSV